MANEQIALSFKQGITSVPSDATCDDNALEESVGMVYDNGEHRVIQKPVEYLTLSEGQTLLYVHKLNNTEYYIVKEGNAIKWGTKTSGNVYSGQSFSMTASGDVQVTSMGNTLIITDNNGLQFYKFDGSSYINLPYPIPDLNFSAKLYCPSPLPTYAYSTGDAEGIIESDDPAQESGLQFSVENGKQEAFNNLVVGLYNKNLNYIAKNKGFAEPFLLRAALEMYDGTYIYITNPIVLLPSVTENTNFFVYGVRTGVVSMQPKKLVAITLATRLYIMQTVDYSAYSDIIKDVVVFASKPISIYETTKDQEITNEYHASGTDWNLGNSVCSTDEEYLTGSQYRSFDKDPDPISGLALPRTSIRCLQKRLNTDIDKDIASTSLFYKIASIGCNAINSYVDIGAYTSQDVTENLTTQEFLKYDDFFSRNALMPKCSYVYNSRLNVANVKRSFVEGFWCFLPLDQNAGYTYTYDVTIKTSSGDVHAIYQKRTDQKQGIYFYYPDTRATHVKIYKGTNLKILDVDLKEHPFLHGSYYYAGFRYNTDEPTGVSESVPAVAMPSPEVLYNYIVQSEVNNPWAFLASGYHAVGTGEVIGASTITQALSEGQFGTYPLIVFSENGIWAMSVDGTGLYVSMEPMSREICNRAKSITQTDGAVYFASEKGLMVIGGGKVRCVSEQLAGRARLTAGTTNETANGGTIETPFCEFLKDAVIAYDYRDSLLWIFTNNNTNAWVYSIKSGTFGRYGLNTEGTAQAITVVNNYPDYLIQNGTKVYSLLTRKNINLDGTTTGSVFYPNIYSGTIITRPMKLENGLALKSIMQIKHVLQFSPYNVVPEPANTETQGSLATETQGSVNQEPQETGTQVTEPADTTPDTQRGAVSLRIFASNNLDKWVELKSLRGTPWKYYKFEYDFTNLIATDRFSGSVLITQERRTNKLR